MAHILTNPIPDISDDKLKELVARIQTVRSNNVGELFVIDQPNPYQNLLNASFATPAGKLEPWLSLRMYSVMSTMRAFQPSMEELLAQVPEDYLDTVAAIHLVGEVRMEPGDEYASVAVTLMKAA